ncbi:ElyC/SanA/YdcF family protein [Vibrio diazotrophicus]|uniref:SanA/YdcF family protein n=1 Tax=Vibrio diazotrophicus TaxID=685 RepID=UPI00142DE230|nr:DUF218 domain-containing protein [Vibrio diazotrophicus]
MGSKTSSHLKSNSLSMRMLKCKSCKFKNMPWLKRGLRLLSVFVILSALSIYGIDRWVSWRSEDHIISDITQVPEFQVAVVLGTSKYLGKTLNEYYSHRINAAISLYDLGKVHRFLLSGDNAHRSYNEPWTMKRDLLKAGIPDASIFLDYAGFRTLDSIVRAKRIFDTDNFLIITQRFHCERALFIAQYHDINATCLAVSDPVNSSGLKIRTREVFARTKAFFDLYIFNTQPKFLGPKEPIVIESEPNSELEATIDSEQSIDSTPQTQTVEEMAEQPPQDDSQ